MSPKPRRPGTRAAAGTSVYQVKITLAEVEPPVWRRIRVRGDLRLDRLHAVFQKAMGWQSAHLHEWIVSGRRYGEPEPDEPHYQVKDESLLSLREGAPIEGTRFGYVYDLGDNWTHEVVVEKITCLVIASRPTGPIMGSRRNTMTKVAELVDRYVAVWNEPDADRRRKGIEQLWAEDGAHFTPSVEARGYKALEARVAGAYEKWVKAEGFVFKSANNVETHHDGVRFNWEMVPAAGGTVAAVGFDFLVLGDDGRIRLDYQFLDRPPAP